MNIKQKILTTAAVFGAIASLSAGTIHAGEVIKIADPIMLEFTVLSPETDTTTDSQVDITMKLKLKDHVNNNFYINKDIKIYPSLFNQDKYPEVRSNDNLEEKAISVRFTTINEEKVITFEDINPSFKGKNFIQCGTLFETYPNGFYQTGCKNDYENINDMFTNQSYFNYSGSKLPIHRYFNRGTTSHFYTISNVERISLLSNNVWRHEGIAYYVSEQSNSTCPESNQSMVYRFYNLNTGTHFYTGDVNEKNSIIKNDPNWNYENEAFCAYNSKAEGLNPVYRFYNKTSGSHFFTISEYEMNEVKTKDPNWNFEGVAYYAEI